jgi:DNA polymerase III epsilon subunit-like protein
MNAPRTIIIDFETFYDKDYHLNTKAKGGLSFPLYIHDPRFKVHGLAVDDGKGQRWIAGKDVPAFLKTVKNDILVAHNGFFDFGILAWHYKFTPAYMLDTLLLANHVFGAAMDVGESNRLADLAARMGLTAKMEMPPFMKGLREPDEARWRPSPSTPSTTRSWAGRCSTCCCRR